MRLPCIDEAHRERLVRIGQAVLDEPERVGVHPAGPADDEGWVRFCDAANSGHNVLLHKLKAIS